MLSIGLGFVKYLPQVCITMKIGANKKWIGRMPRYEDLDWKGLDVSRETYEKLAKVDPKAWLEEVEDTGKLFDRLKSRLPPEMEDKRKELERAVS